VTSLQKIIGSEADCDLVELYSLSTSSKIENPSHPKRGVAQSFEESQRKAKPCKIA